MPRLIVEVDYFDPPLADWGWLQNLAPGLEDVGLEPEFRVAPAPIAGEGRNLSERMLHAHLGRQIDRRGQREAESNGSWYLHLLIAESHRSGFLGQMFDFMRLDNRHREGCAIFTEAIRRTLTDTAQPLSFLGRLVARTAFHEFGHAFNLAHSEQFDTAAMTPLEELHRRNPQSWPLDLQARFNDRQRRFIHSNPQIARPATRIPFQPRDPAESFLISDENNLRITLSFPESKPNEGLPIGYPLMLRVELRNTGIRPEEVPANPSLDAGTLAIRLQSEFDSDAKQLQSPQQVCLGIPRTRLLQPGESLILRENLFFDRQGWTLSTAGDYEVTAAIQVGNDPARWIASASSSFRIDPWKDRHDGMVEQLLDPLFGRYLYLGAPSHLTQMHRRAHSLLKECPEKTIAASLSGCLAADALRRASREQLTDAYRRRVCHSAVSFLNAQMRNEIDPFRRGRAAIRLTHTRRQLGEHVDETEIQARFGNDIAIYEQTSG